MGDNAPRHPPKQERQEHPHNDRNQIRCRMISVEEKTPRTERKPDVPPKLQSLGKNHVEHLYPGIVNNVVATWPAGWQEPRDGEEQARRRRQLRSQSFREGANLCQGHLVGRLLLII